MTSKGSDESKKRSLSNSSDESETNRKKQKTSETKTKSQSTDSSETVRKLSENTEKTETPFKSKSLESVYQHIRHTSNTSRSKRIQEIESLFDSDEEEGDKQITSERKGSIDSKSVPIVSGSPIVGQQLSTNKSHITKEIDNKMKLKCEKYLDKLLKQNLSLGQLINRGSFGYVVKGIFESQEVAVKISDIEKNLDLSKIFDSYLKLSHENIISVKYWLRENDVLFIAMPLAETDLFNDVFKNGALSEFDTRQVAQQLISGLQYLHNNGYAHRDIKPENILIFGKKYVITDFDSMIKCIDENGNPIKSSNRRVGTHIYMSPELLQRQGSADFRLADIWSFGVTLFTIFSYTFPFGEIYVKDSAKLDEKLRAMRLSDYRFASDRLPSNELEGLIFQMIEYNQNARFNCNQMIANEWFDIDLPETHDRYKPTPKTQYSINYGLTGLTSVSTSSNQSNPLTSHVRIAPHTPPHTPPASDSNCRVSGVSSLSSNTCNSGSQQKSKGLQRHVSGHSSI